MLVLDRALPTEWAFLDPVLCKTLPSIQRSHQLCVNKVALLLSARNSAAPCWNILGKTTQVQGDHRGDGPPWSYLVHS